MLDGPAAGAGLGLLDVSDAAGDLLECPHDPDFTLEEVYLLALEPRELASAAAEVDSAEHESPELRVRCCYRGKISHPRKCSSHSDALKPEAARATVSAGIS